MERAGSSKKKMHRSSAQVSGKMVSARVVAMQKTQRIMETIQAKKPVEKMTKRKLSTLNKALQNC
eukprot:4300791-Prymnesium_polylepis.1